jgi:hypothetical protein
MKTSFATTALIIACGLSAGSAFASYSSARLTPDMGEAPFFQIQAASSTLTRAAVKAEYIAAQKAGTLPANGELANVQGNFAPSTLSREAVKADYLQARKAGTLPTSGERG